MKKSFLLFLLLASTSFAGVNLKNGNFYRSFVDITVPGAPKKFEIKRTYNSKTSEVGWFGFGWGSLYETKLIVSADGSIVVHENGAGARTRFIPKNAIDGGKAAVKIIEAMKKKTQLTGKAEKDLLKRLSTFEELRHIYARNYGVSAPIATGTVLHSNDRGIQSVEKRKEDYKRIKSADRTDFFNLKGQLTKIKYKSGYSVALTYEKGKLYSVKNSLGKQIFVSFNSAGFMDANWTSGDKKSFYKYEKDLLVSSGDVWDNKFIYKYDKNKNMTNLAFKDKTAESMKYHPKTLNVIEVVDRNKESTKYKYEKNQKNPELHYWTSVTRKGFAGKPITNRYEYEIKIRKDGSRYTYRIQTGINGVNTETIYSECCSLPLKISRGKHVTNFEYNDRGLLTKKTSTKGEYVELQYHKTFNKITKVTNKAGWTEYSYNKKANLTKAISSKGQAVLLVYDSNGKITKMVDQNKKTKARRTLSFRYNATGKPTEIAMDKIGKINVAYDNYGEIKNVESKQGSGMAVQVTQAFQNLLAIVKPAGVNLNI